VVGTHHTVLAWVKVNENKQKLASAVTLPQADCVQSVRVRSSGPAAERARCSHAAPRAGHRYFVARPWLGQGSRAGQLVLMCRCWMGREADAGAGPGGLEARRMRAQVRPW
jgi:hypothetical protein